MVSVLAVAALLLPAGKASAQTSLWTQVDSGTQHAITAVEYQSDERFWYATAKGEIFRQVGGVPQLQVTDPNAIPFNDIAMQPGGNVGIAVGNSGTVYRTTDGATWSKVPALGLQTLDHDCVSGSPALEDVTGDLLSVTWADASTVYLAGKERVVLRSTDAGLTFSERNKQPNLTCRASELLYDITDTVFAGGVGYLVSDGTAHTWRTGEGLATDVLARARAVECGTRPRLALDPVDLNRLWAVAKCSSATAFTYSEDGGATFGTVGLPGDVVNGLADVAVAPGTLIAVGNSGEILISRDGRTASRWPGFGTLGNHNWQAVDLADGARGAVGGDDGVLLTTTLAATVPMPPGATPPGGPFPGPSPPPGLPPDPTPPPGPPPGPSPPPDPSPSPGPPADTSPPPGPTPPPGPSPPPILTPAPGASPGGAPAGGDRGAGPATQRGTPRLTLRLRTRHGARGRVWLRVTGALVLPDTMNRTAGCRGRVTLGIKAGGRTLVRRRVAILPNCSFGTRLLALRGSRLASATRLAVVAQFGGNRVLERAERSLSRRVG